jgi:hypothetical protein
MEAHPTNPSESDHKPILTKPIWDFSTRETKQRIWQIRPQKGLI